MNGLRVGEAKLTSTRVLVMSLSVCLGGDVSVVEVVLQGGVAW